MVGDNNTKVITVQEFFELFIRCDERMLKSMVDLYNGGELCSNARAALEAIENVDSPPVVA